MLMLVRRFAWLLLVALGGAALAQPPDPRDRTGLPGESPPVGRRLDRAQKLVEEKQYADAIDEFQRILDESGDALVPLPDGQDAKEQSTRPRHCLHARRLCHQRLAALPPEALKLYRSRVDGQAKTLVEQGLANHDPRLLQRVVNDMFCSRPAERALNQLGDLAFERGDFDEAERWWRLLALPASESVEREARNAEHKSDPTLRAWRSALAYPTPQLDIALVRAKQLLARLFRGDDSADIGRELRAFRHLHNKVEGSLAGRKGRFADILDELHRQAEPGAEVAEDEPWSTFAGAPTRSHLAPRLPRAIHLDEPTWRVRLAKPTEQPKRAEPDEHPPTPPKLPPPAFHPVIAGEHVLVADARSVTAFDLLTGRQTGKSDLAVDLDVQDVDKMDLAGEWLLAADLRYTLTVSANLVYARLGSVALADRRGRTPGSYLVCLRLPPKNGRLIPHWEKPIPAVPNDKGATAFFEGPPLVRDGRVYIARTRFSGAQATTAIDCFDPDTGAPRWQQDVCDAQEGGEPRYRHHLLTLAGPHVVYCSHSGAIVAVDAATGRRVWGVRYPSRGLRTGEGLPSPRDPAPCVYAAGRLFVAPADADRIFCLDAWTGEILWESTAVEAVHLLGVAEGRLLFTTATRYRRGIRALDAVTGNDVWVHEEGDLPASGRGLLAEGTDEKWVYWPVGPLGTGAKPEYRLYALSARDGEPRQDIRRTGEPLGNLAYSNGCLIVAGPEEIKAYVSEARFLNKRRKEAQAKSVAPLPRYRLALAEIAAGQHTEALANLARVEQLTAGAPGSLREQARRRQHELLLELATAAARQKRWDEAAAKLREAAGPEFPVSLRLRAIQQEATLWSRTNRPDRAVTVWRTVLEDAALCRGQVEDGQRNPQTAGILASTCIRALSPKPQNDSAISVKPPAPNGHRSPSDEATTRPPLRLPLLRSWQVDSPPSERLVWPRGDSPLASRNTLVFACDKELICRDAAIGKTCWRRKLSWTPVWLDCSADMLLAAGARGIACLARADGADLWQFAAPSAERGTAEAGCTPGVEPLGSFTVAGSRLFCLDGNRRLLALDTGTGAVLWHHWAPSAQLDLAAPHGRFHPLYTAGNDWLMIQTSSGKCWLLDSRTGRRIHEDRRETELWPQPPITVDDRRVCIVAADRLNSRLRIVMLEPATGKEVWVHEIERWPSLTGELPHLTHDADTLLLLVPRNYGYELDCLNVATGKRRWKEARYLGTERITLADVAIDRNNVYVPLANVLRAYSLAECAKQWEAPLGGSARRRVLRVGDLLAIVSTEAAYDSEAGLHVFAIAFHDGRDGRLVQRLSFTAEEPQAGFALFRGGAAVALSGMTQGFTTGKQN